MNPCFSRLFAALILTAGFVSYADTPKAERPPAIKSEEAELLSPYVGKWTQVPAPLDNSNPWLGIGSSKENGLVVTRYWTGFLGLGDDLVPHDRSEHETQFRGSYNKKIELGGPEKYVSTESGEYTSFWKGGELYIIDYREDKNYRRSETKPYEFTWVKSLKRLSLSGDGKTLTVKTLDLERYPLSVSRPRDFDKSGKTTTYKKQDE